MNEETGQRQDIIEALRVLGDRGYQARCWGPHAEAELGCDVSLTDAVHWLIDDTWLDERSADELIPMILRSRKEAEKVDRAVQHLVAVLEDVGPVAVDSAYLDHDRWSSVVEACHAALEAMGGAAASSDGS